MNSGVVKRELVGRTLIFVPEHAGQVMEIDGVVVLPVGAEIELTKPEIITYRVTKVRVLAGSETGPVQVCLDVVAVPRPYEA
jgi:hypothetical protein